ncbi:tRNA (guanosine(46)-N7)-methyltransferase TrmB [Mesotoga sp. BH458_6_3_2_1]|uniref:tRNA (guanosine(46)-N7)-methyltransferase TrmB n=1 Tax=Mesotoga sp. BH458_6_3_2_1 TaxID=1437446 RepID=UPI000EF2768A|nr:tRNA (guanosine(46)-N7)-methyltransferase TrmB [Mesotoga sp. BH458_6_3_2_1]RLL87398.1 tRNA (guanine-N7)-methyltransferase [Mesotoga sp. BH458_6_3_2_1]
MNLHYLGNYLDATEFDLPLNLNCIFGRDNDVFLEIGFGSGEFLVQKAVENPGVDLLGVELSMISAEKLLKSLVRNSLDNVRVLLIDASFALANIIPPTSISGVYMNFPCPWPKKRHSSRRLNDTAFVEKIAAVLKPDGFFQLYSDSKEFVHQMMLSVNETKLFSTLTFEENPSSGAKTRYERKWLSMEKEIFRFYCKRKERVVSIEKDVIHVSHLWLKEVDEVRLGRLIGEAFSRNEVFVKFLGVYRSLESEAFLIETLSVDRGFSQRFNITLSRREAGWLIQLDSQLRPIRTQAVRFALKTLSSLVGKEPV